MQYNMGNSNMAYILYKSLIIRLHKKGSFQIREMYRMMSYITFKSNNTEINILQTITNLRRVHF